MPKAIREAFERTLQALQGILGGSQSAQSSSENTGSGFHNAHPTFERDTEATPSLGL